MQGWWSSIWSCKCWTRILFYWSVSLSESYVNQTGNSPNPLINCQVSVIVHIFISHITSHSPLLPILRSSLFSQWFALSTSHSDLEMNSHIYIFSATGKSVNLKSRTGNDPARALPFLPAHSRLSVCPACSLRNLRLHQLSALTSSVKSNIHPVYKIYCITFPCM